HAAAEERAEWHVGDHAPPDRITQERTELFDRLRLRDAQFLGEPKVPVRLDGYVTALPHQAMAWGQFVQVAIRGRWCRYVQVRQVVVDRTRVHFAGHGRVSQQRL